MIDVQVFWKVAGSEIAMQYGSNKLKMLSRLSSNMVLGKLYGIGKAPNLLEVTYYYY